jgi:hypothetical protein
VTQDSTAELVGFGLIFVWLALVAFLVLAFAQ